MAISDRSTEPEYIHAGDPECLCGAFHLPADKLEDDGPGHCLCGCHGRGQHLDEAPCTCNLP